jgi:preprotein translocase subunit SecY
MALGIMPYISASIIVQLMGMAIPYLQKLQKDGESGRNTLNQITRWLTIGVCLVQAPSYLTSITQLFYHMLSSSAYYVEPILYVLVTKYCYFGGWFSICNVVR